MIDKHYAILDLYPQVGSILDLEAFDKEGNRIEIDIERVEARAIEMVAEKENARQSALKKLMALGLTEEEALALGVK